MTQKKLLRTNSKKEGDFRGKSHDFFMNGFFKYFLGQIVF